MTAEVTDGASPANPAAAAKALADAGGGVSLNGTTLTLPSPQPADVTGAANAGAIPGAIKSKTKAAVAKAKKAAKETLTVDVAYGNATKQAATVDTKDNWPPRFTAAKTAFGADKQAWFTVDDLANAVGLSKAYVTSELERFKTAGMVEGDSLGPRGLKYYSFVPATMHPENKTKLKDAATTRFASMKSNWEADVQSAKVKTFSFEDATIPDSVKSAGISFIEGPPEGVHSSPLNSEEIETLVNGDASPLKQKFQSLCATGAQTPPATGGEGGAIAHVISYARSHDVGPEAIAAIKYNGGAGPYGTIVMPGQREVSDEVRTPLQSLGILPFMKSLATSGQAGTLKLARFNEIWNKDSATKQWVGDRFRAANRGQHEFLPCDLINEVVNRAANSREFFEGAKWIDLQDQLRVPTTNVVFAAAAGRRVEGKLVPQGHSGSVKGPDPENPTRIIDQTQHQEAWHSFLEAAFHHSTSFATLRANLELFLNDSLWLGGATDIHPSVTLNGKPFDPAAAAQTSRSVIQTVLTTIDTIAAQ